MVCGASTLLTCSAIKVLLNKGGDLKASHEILNTEIILDISQIGVEIRKPRECFWQDFSPNLNALPWQRDVIFSKRFPFC